jgi:muramoyltetrapeptide carboxypeptidase
MLFANTDERRLAHLRAAVYAEDSNLIWCVRGGYGSIRLLEGMARWPKPRRAKMLLGYSDVTTLHAFVNQRWGWPSLHGPMLERLGRAVAPSERKFQLDVIFGRRAEASFGALKPLNHAARAARVIRAPILGGNAAVLQSSLGTPFALDPRGAILFLEDIGERPHRVDRMLTQFRQAGWFDRARAVVFGHFQLAAEADRRQLRRDVFPRFAAEVKIPVLGGLPVGHDPRRQLTLPLNTPAVLSLGPRGSLRVRTGLL